MDRYTAISTSLISLEVYDAAIRRQFEAESNVTKILLSSIVNSAEGLK